MFSFINIYNIEFFLISEDVTCPDLKFTSDCLVEGSPLSDIPSNNIASLLYNMGLIHVKLKEIVLLNIGNPIHSRQACINQNDL